ncbi:hypothetical protein GCM10023187_36210 [Nibrella viscosa]|uniref:Beta-lactamase n=1 Tax=Nibrella viscosa TaxID=1084524 RepID=A0ABP8KPC5_9BACT
MKKIAPSFLLFFIVSSAAKAGLWQMRSTTKAVQELRQSRWPGQEDEIVRGGETPEHVVLQKRLLPTSNPLRTVLDKRLDDAVTRFVQEQGNVVGLCVGVVRKDSVFVYGYGETAKGTNRLPNGNTVFEIGSVSKTFTATLLAEAVRDNKIKLEAPVNRYLPDSIPILQKNGVPVTAKMLSNHTSGLPRLPDNLFSGSISLINPYKHYTHQDLFAWLKRAQLLRQPGTQYEYSNLAVGLLGVILERVHAMPYESLVKDHITRLLGMQHTTITLTKAGQADMAQGYNDRKEPASVWDFQALAGAGGIRSTVNDMLIYLKAQWGKGPKPLVKAMALAHKPTYTQEGRVVGLGWHMATGDIQGWLWHNGKTGGYSSFAGFRKDRQMAVVILANSLTDLDKLGVELVKVVGQ